MLLHRDGVVGAALDGGVVGHDDARATRNAPDAGDDASGRSVAVVHVLSGKWRELKECRAFVEELFDSVSGQQLAAVDVALPRAFWSAKGSALESKVQLGQQFLIDSDALGPFGRGAIHN